MEIWDKIFRALAAIGGAIAGFFGGWNALLTVLAVAMVMDYISGVIVAACGRSLKTAGGGIDSKVGFVGLAKKAFILLIVLMGTMLDRALGTDTAVFQTATSCYYIANEGISILENAGLMGLPVPKVIRRALEQMRAKGDGDEDEEEDEEHGGAG